MNSLVAYEVSSSEGSDAEESDEKQENVDSAIASIVHSLVNMVSSSFPQIVSDGSSEGFGGMNAWRVTVKREYDSDGEEETTQPPLIPFDESDEEDIFQALMEQSRKHRLAMLKEKDEEPAFGRQKTVPKLTSQHVPRTRGEIGLDQLPPIEKLSLTLGTNVQIHKIGVISSVVETLVIVKSDFDVPPLDIDTVVFTRNADHTREALGVIFETFGPVTRPLYSIRFNTEDDIAALKLMPGKTEVFFAPTVEEFTKTVFTDALRKLKGTDASWDDNNEPPPEIQYFSDDEQERKFKAKNRHRKSNRNIETVTVPEKDDNQGNDDVQVIYQNDVLSVDSNLAPNSNTVTGTSALRWQTRVQRQRGRGRRSNRGGRGHQPDRNRSSNDPQVFPQSGEQPPAFNPMFAWPPRGQMPLHGRGFNSQPPSFNSQPRGGWGQPQHPSIQMHPAHPYWQPPAFGGPSRFFPPPQFLPHESDRGRGFRMNGQPRGRGARPPRRGDKLHGNNKFGINPDSFNITDTRFMETE